MATTGEHSGIRGALRSDGVLAAGRVVADYVIDAHVGSGSSADVYRAHRIDDARPVALKVLHTRSVDPIRLRDRFDREFTIASLLHHPNIVEMYARGEIPSVDSPDTDSPATTLWIAMEYVAGTSAMNLIPSEKTEPDIARIVALGDQIAAALDHAHRHDVLHRDVKPGNIIVESDGHSTHAVLTDFGIAQLLDDARPLARNGRVQGSIAYAAPELLTAQRLSPQTDEYALAASMFELLVGSPPYPRPTAFAVTHAHLHDQVPLLTRTRPWLPSSLNSVFAKALAKDPRDRYDTCGEFTAIITRTLRDVPVPEPAPPRRFGLPRKSDS
ncbi:serine/threonine-protein kinase [Gordonia sp. CPCC 205515]|uniref:serine/threonine-protein kinase n=1 Tax=Gordonia sp. CPCC 205515 TaxID=3140791 RepID=UPI003AF394F9